MSEINKEILSNLRQKYNNRYLESENSKRLDVPVFKNYTLSFKFTLVLKKNYTLILIRCIWNVSLIYY